MDSVIYERLHPRHDPYTKQRTAQNLEAFANEGLRTLYVAKRVIDEGEYAMWSQEYEEAAAATEEREEKIDAANEKIERDYILSARLLWRISYRKVFPRPSRCCILLALGSSCGFLREISCKLLSRSVNRFPICKSSTDRCAL